jgi:hypothetical protein
VVIRSSGTLSPMATPNLVRRDRSAAKMREQPKDQRQPNTQNQTSHNRKIKSSVFPAMHHIPRQSPQPQRQSGAKKQKRPRHHRHRTKNQQRPPNFSHPIHNLSWYVVIAGVGNQPSKMPRPVIPRSAPTLSPPTSLLRSWGLAQSRNLSSIYCVSLAVSHLILAN